MIQFRSEWWVKYTQVLYSPLFGQHRLSSSGIIYKFKHQERKGIWKRWAGQRRSVPLLCLSSGLWFFPITQYWRGFCKREIIFYHIWMAAFKNPCASMANHPGFRCFIWWLCFTISGTGIAFHISHTIVRKPFRSSQSDPVPSESLWGWGCTHSVHGTPRLHIKVLWVPVWKCLIPAHLGLEHLPWGHLRAGRCSVLSKVRLLKKTKKLLWNGSKYN